jgi:endoribonuclease Dicer
MTPLCAELDSKYEDMEYLFRLLRISKEAASELGQWAADRLWSIALAEDEANKAEREVERMFLSERVVRPVEVLNRELERVREAKEIVKNHVFSPPKLDCKSVSSKVIALRLYLNSVFEKPTDARCIVFVQKRYTARLLGELFKHIGSSHMRMGLLIGTNGGETGDIKFTFRQQVLTLMKFRKGEINCLVSVLHILLDIIHYQ